MSKWAKITIVAITVVVILLLGAVAAAYFGVVLPYRQAQSAMPEYGMMTLVKQDDYLLLTWPGGDGAGEYRVEVFSSDGESRLFTRTTRHTSCSLPNNLLGRDCTIRVSPVAYYNQFGEQKERLGEQTLEAAGRLTLPEILEPGWNADPDSKQVQVTYSLPEGVRCRLFRLFGDGQKDEISDQSGNFLSLRFGEGGQFAVPEDDGTVKFALEPYLELPGLVFFGNEWNDISLSHEDFLGRNLNLRVNDEGNNRFTLHWDETKGEVYQVQQSGSDGSWTTVCEIKKTGERSYSTGYLAPYSEFSYRVLAVGGQVPEGSEFAAQSEPVTLETKESPIYCTIWPMTDMPAYKDADGADKIGTVTGSKAYCVIDEKNGRFAVQTGDGIGYIDSNYCLINLPEYLGSLCLYDITNSHNSIYMVHEFEIPEVTNTVIKGYEHIELYDKTVLVPLLYPTARKLANACALAGEQGCRIKIYDSFRPHEATLDIYKRTEAVLDEALPENPFSPNVNIEDLNLPAPREEIDEEGNVTEIPLTYRDVMLGKYSLNNFLARRASKHNYGIAMDLTLTDQWGNDIKMQSSMHDLSHYSATENNTETAIRLKKIMTEAGFGGLVSEWWHFQDNEAFDTLSLSIMQKGLSGECWMKDDYGWRYRLADGRYYRSCTVIIDGVSCTFDENGYFQTESK